MRYLGTILAALVGWMIPGFVLERLITLQKRRIENGLPDALDLMIVCVEAGCGLDQAILKASDELMISHPALATELQMITTEMRAGKPRIERSRTSRRGRRSTTSARWSRCWFRPTVRHERRAGAADARRRVADEAAAAGRGEGRQDRREARVPAGVLPVPGVLRGHAGTRSHPVHPSPVPDGGSKRR